MRPELHSLSQGPWASTHLSSDNASDAVGILLSFMFLYLCIFVKTVKTFTDFFPISVQDTRVAQPLCGLPFACETRLCDPCICSVRVLCAQHEDIKTENCTWPLSVLSHGKGVAVQTFRPRPA